MKTKHLAIIACLSVSVFQLHSQGYIVPNGVTYDGLSFGGYQMSVVSDPANGGSTAFFLDLLDMNTFRFGPLADEGVRVFMVSYDDPISLQPIMSGSYLELAYPYPPYSYVFGNGSPFYVGLYTGSAVPVNGVYPNPLFGWAELVNNNGVIQLLDGALVYQAEGIYAGTQTIIPEPCVVTLAALGTLLLGFRRRQHSAQ
jgi:hypothetical protein